MESSRSNSQLADVGMLSLRRGMLLFVPLMFVGNLLGVLLRYPEHGSAILYPPYAALTAVLLASRRRDWIAYILVDTVLAPRHEPRAVGVFVGACWPNVAIIARALVATLLLQRLLGPRPRLDGLASLLRFVIAAVIVAPAVGATIGAANVVLHDTSATYQEIWELGSSRMRSPR